MINKHIFLTLLLILFSFILSAQEVDLLRLTYNENKTTSIQTGVTVSNDGRLIAFHYADKTIKILNATNGRVIRVLKGVHDDFFELRFNYNATKLISVGHGNKVAVLDIKSGDVLDKFELPYNVTRTAISKTEDLIAFGMEEPQVDIYNLVDYDLVSSIIREGHHVSGIDFDPNGEIVAIAIALAKGKKSPVTFHNISDGIKKYETEAGVYASVNYNHDGSKVYFAGTRDIFTGIVDEFNISDRSLRYLYTKFNKKSLTLYLGIEVYGETILAVSVDKKFEVIDVNTGRITLTTLNDKTKGLLGLKNFGVDSKRIFPLYDGKSFLINYTDNNITQIYNAETMNISGYIFSDSNDDLVVAARDGRLDGSVDPMSYIYWSERKSNKETPLASTFDQFFTPRLLPTLLSNETIQSNANNLVEALEMAPSVSISTPDTITTSTSMTIDITYLTQANGDPVKDVIVAVNGKSMGTGTRGFKRIGNESISVSLVQGRNIIQLTAVSDKGYQSIPDQVIVNYEGTPASSNLYLLTVGLDAYKNPKYNLNYANADATAFKTTIVDGSQTIFQGVKEYFIKDGDATKENIESKFNELASIIGPEDVFVFYYAGHGVMSEEEKPMFYVAPYDVTQLYGNNEMLHEKAISADQLKAFSSQISAQKQLFVLDACQSGGMTEMLAMRGAAEEKAIAQLARSTGTYWLTASGSEQFATEFAELGHGLFTYTLLEGLSGKADGGSNDGKITVKELSAYLNDRVPELSEQYKGQAQYPTSYGFGQDFPVVIVK